MEKFPNLFHDKGTARLVACHKDPIVSHGMGVDMLEAARDLHHAVDMRTALVGKGRIPDIGRLDIARDVYNLIQGKAHLAQVLYVIRAGNLPLRLEHEIRDNRRQVRVAAPFPVTVQNALDHREAR